MHVQMPTGFLNMIFVSLVLNLPALIEFFANQFLEWNKKSIGENEVRSVLEDEQMKVRLFSSRTKTEYLKCAVIDKEY